METQSSLLREVVHAARIADLMNPDVAAWLQLSLD
jgi:hypothetical protein